VRPYQVFQLIARRHRRQGQLVRSVHRRTHRLAAGSAALRLLAGMAAAVVVSLFYGSLTADLPSLSNLPDLLDPAQGLFLQPTRLYDRTGEHLLLTLENPGIPRKVLYLDPVQPDHFSPELLRVVLALKEPGFWSSPGFDWRRMTDPQPATLAEDLALDLLLAQEPPSTRRALRMRILAAQMVSQYGRARVLEWYLNSAAFGHLSYGAESAAQLYLGHSAGTISLSEAALLAPLIDTPALNPLDAPVAAEENRQTALETLFAKGIITADEFTAARDAPPTIRALPQETERFAAAFTALVVDNLSARLGRERLERGGYRIITTLDYDLQTQMTCLTEEYLRRLTGERPQVSPGCSAAGLLPTLNLPMNAPAGTAVSAALLDEDSGEVLALLGDTTLEGETAYLTAHEPGSLLSPFVALTSFAYSYGPGSLVWDLPPSDDPLTEARSDEAFHGPVRLRMALANDYLTPITQILDQVGAGNVWRLASNLGLGGLVEEQDSRLLRSGGRLTTLELAQAYSVFPSMGRLSGGRPAGGGALAPQPVLFVEDVNGRVLVDNSTPEHTAVVSPALAYLVHDVLSDEPARRVSLGYPNPFEISRPAGAKAGQTEDGSQVWAAGYTADHVAVFWLGLPANAKGETLLDSRQAGGMWYALLQYADRDLPVKDWPEPEGLTRLTVCDPSGLLPTAACPNLVEEIFLTGNQPTGADTLFQTVQVNRETGRLATVFTPSELIDERVYMIVPYQARAWAAANGVTVPPEVYDAIQPPPASADVNLTAPQLFAYVSGEVDLRGTAAGAGFQVYRLQAGSGLNPATWMRVAPDGSNPVQDGLLGVWDTRGLEGLYALRLLVVREDQTIENATIQVTVDNTAPLVNITYPQAQASIQMPSNRSITFQAEASAALGIKRMEWWVDGSQVGENLTAPYSFVWQASAGEHRLEARAYDPAGNMATSTAVQFTVTR